MKSTYSRKEISDKSARFLETFEIKESEIQILFQFKEEVVPKIPETLETFYTWLRSGPDYDIFFSDPSLQKEVLRMQTKYWTDFFQKPIDESYIESRLLIGEAHARIGLSLTSFFSAMSKFQSYFTDKILNTKSKLNTFELLSAFTKRMHFDTTLIVDTYNSLTNQRIADQNRSLYEMSTPVTEIWQGILMLPIVGVLDSKRAQDIMDSILQKITISQASVAVIDISGVAVVDTAVANHLFKITKASKLMGCETTISGISPTIAQTIVELGIDVSELKTTATLKEALRLALKSVGLEIHENHK